MRACVRSGVLVTVCISIGIASAGAKADMPMIAPKAAAHTAMDFILFPLIGPCHERNALAKERFRGRLKPAANYHVFAAAARACCRRRVFSVRAAYSARTITLKA